VKYLLDTDTCIHVLRGNPGVVSRVSTIAADDLAVSSITYYELLYGVKRCALERQRAELRKVDTFIGHLHQLPFGAEMARNAAEIRRELESKGHGIGPMDTLIAATALEADLTLVTGNLKEFSRIQGLRSESWIR